MAKPRTPKPPRRAQTPPGVQPGATIQDILNALSAQRNQALDAAALAEARLAAYIRDHPEPPEAENERKVSDPRPPTP